MPSRASSSAPSMLSFTSSAWRSAPPKLLVETRHLDRGLQVGGVTARERAADRHTAAVEGAPAGPVPEGLRDDARACAGKVVLQRQQVVGVRLERQHRRAGTSCQERVEADVGPGVDDRHARSKGGFEEVGESALESLYPPTLLKDRRRAVKPAAACQVI